MNDLNHVMLEGRMTRDPELVYSPTALAICNFVIANNNYKKNGEEWEQQANFIPIVTFDQLAETVYDSKKKGDKIRITGTLKQSTWQDTGGEKHTRLYVVAKEIR